MKHLLGPAAFCAAVMIAIVGCGSPSTASPSGSAGPAASSAAVAPSSDVPSAAATSSPSAVASASSPASLPSLPAIFSSHADPALEAQLPAEVSGTALERYSITLADLLDAGGDRASIDAFLQGIGKTEADGSFAAVFDLDNAIGGGIFAFKVTGVDTAALLEAIVTVERSDLGGDPTTRQGTVGGKGVTIVSNGAGANDTEWIYGRGDVVFVVHAVDETQASAYLQALP